jgi:hypothetical protein
MHDEYTISLMDNKTDAIWRTIEMEEIDEFSDYPALVRRIILDRPAFWEGELTKELLDHLLLPLQEKHEDIKSGSFLPDTYVVVEGKEVQYIRRKMAEATRMISNIEALYTDQLTQSWGPPGESGDPKGILRVCKLIERTLSKMIEWESELEGVFLEDEDYAEAFEILKGAVGRQFSEVLKVNGLVADTVDQVRKMRKGDTLSVEHTIVFSLPEDFAERFDAAIRAVARRKGVAY